MKKPEPPADLWSQLDGYRASLVSVRPPNSITAKEWSTRYGCTMSTAYKELNKLVRDGRMERSGTRYYVLKK